MTLFGLLATERLLVGLHGREDLRSDRGERGRVLLLSPLEEIRGRAELRGRFVQVPGRDAERRGELLQLSAG